MERKVGIHGNMYTWLGPILAGLAVYVVEPEGVLIVVFVAINMVSRFLRDVMLRILFFVRVLLGVFLHLDVGFLALERRDDRTFRVYDRFLPRVVR